MGAHLLLVTQPHSPDAASSSLHTIPRVLERCLGEETAAPRSAAHGVNEAGSPERTRTSRGRGALAWEPSRLLGGWVGGRAQAGLPSQHLARPRGPQPRGDGCRGPAPGPAPRGRPPPPIRWQALSPRSPSPSRKQSASIHLTGGRAGRSISAPRPIYQPLSAHLDSHSQARGPRRLRRLVLTELTAPRGGPGRPSRAAWPWPPAWPHAWPRPSASSRAPRGAFTRRPAPPRPRGGHPRPGSGRNRLSEGKRSRVIYQRLSGPSEAGSGRAQRWRQPPALIKFPSSAG